ncbi:MAG: response regulator, partial [Proteobacteria bacterium]|nr:response regulator [Pseudomonadota bacterium]
MNVSNPEKKLLCIDDDRSIIKVVDKVMSNAFGKNVLQFHEAATGEAGLEKIKELKPDIVLCDINIPGLNGFEVCRQVRKSGLLTAVVLMSAYDDDEDPASQAKEAGADAFLAKPIKKGELLFVVNYILRIDSLNDAVFTKNQQLEKSLTQVNEFHQKLEHLNEELQGDKKSLNENLKELIRLNSQLESKNSQISEMNAELAKRFDSTVGLLASIIEIHQVERRGHSERVANISVYIAEKMELSERLVQNIKTAA